MKNYLLLIIVLVVANLFLAVPAAEAAIVAGPDCSYPNSYIPSGQSQAVPCQIKTIDGTSQLITKIFNLLFGIMILFASFTMIYAAFIYLTSEGMAEEIRKAKRMLIYTIISLVVASLAWGLPRVILSIFA